jgi:hypothetical protein
MSVVIGKLTNKIFESRGGTYHVYSLRVHGGKNTVATFRGEDSPKPLKTVEYVLFGEWVTHKTYGKQLEISRFERSTTHSTEQNNQASILSGAIKAI